jgi:TatD DNase family protein
MITDAHLHLRQLLELHPESLDFINGNDYMACVSCHSVKDVEFAERFRNKVVISFGVHPQDPDQSKLKILEQLILEKRIDAIGEIGFDRYTDEFKKNFDKQIEVFEFQLDLAVKNNFPVTLHIRKAYEEIFNYSRLLSKLPAVIFHSFSGTFEQADFFLKRDVNAFFSFGTPIINGNRKALKTLENLPKERILAETDAPYQPTSGKQFSAVSDIISVIEKAAVIKEVNRSEMENIIFSNFQKILTKKG